jgi:hypothetical protein
MKWGCCDEILHFCQILTDYSEVCQSVATAYGNGLCLVKSPNLGDICDHFQVAKPVLP